MKFGKIILFCSFLLLLLFSVYALTDFTPKADIELQGRYVIKNISSNGVNLNTNLTGVDCTVYSNGFTVGAVDICG